MKLSIIIVSYNTQKLLKQCLGSIYQDLPQNYEIIMIDNASEDNSVSIVQKKYPRVRIIKNKHNLGFTQANNQGITQAKGEYLLLLNSDTIASISALDQMVQFLDKNPQIGLLAPKLLNPDGTIQQNGGGLPNLINIFAWQFFLDEIPLLTHFFQPYQQESPEYYTHTRQTGWVSGAAMMLRSSLVKKIGGLDENIFMYAEDIDICIRANQAKSQVWIYSPAEITHIGHASGSQEKAIIGEYNGLKYIFQKHYPNQAAVISSILYYGASFRTLIFTIIRHEKKANYYRQAAKLVRQPSN